MPRPIAEQVVVITGASSGIGRCTALHVAARGARVVVTARRAEALDALVREIEAAGGRALAVPGDVTREEDLRRVAGAAVERFGRIDTWVNNASVYIQGGVDEITLEEFRRVLEVNLLGLINGTRCALDVMLPRDSGVIVQVSSVMGARGAPYASAYSTAKAGIEGFCDALRSELWGTGLHVCTLYPPTVDTPIYHHARGKWGTVPKPPPPIEDPEKAARVIAGLAERPRIRRTFGPFGYFYLGLAKLPARWADGFLHHAVPFTFSRIPEVGDNLDAPSRLPPRIRAGWAKPGWKGMTLRETARVLPWESVLGAAAAGFVAGRIAKRLGRGSSFVR
jgi:NAD(P)-dependent dehydrogenase (short-subunit alcohol dehydrogenase family)